MEDNVIRMRRPGEITKARLAEMVAAPEVHTALAFSFDGRTWSWDYFGDATVMEIVGALEVIKADIIKDYQEHEEG